MSTPFAVGNSRRRSASSSAFRLIEESGLRISCVICAAIRPIDASRSAIVVAVAPADDVAAALPSDQVVAAQPDDDILALRSVEGVAVLRADDRCGLAQTRRLDRGVRACCSYEDRSGERQERYAYSLVACQHRMLLSAPSAVALTLGRRC